MGLSDRERKTLTRVVDRCRTWLEDEAKDQLETIYGFTREGVPRPLQGLRLSSIGLRVAEQLREWHRHLVGMAAGTPAERQQAAIGRMAEESAFTTLHRLVALRMAEERGVFPPCVRDGLRSDAFRLYREFAGGALGPDHEAYAVFLERVFDDIAVDLPTLFDRREPRSLVFPRPPCLERVVGELAGSDLRRAWEDDDTIGWVYQDFHPADERKKLREGKKVPESSRELAIRNQLFTPRWVVEFLTDNTLGRLWVEMTGVETAIAEHRDYLLLGEVASPVAVKDPRDLRVLDPACGSGHFLLYAFDLLEAIYLDAWDRHVSASPDRTPVWIEYPDRTAFQRQIPVLILRHNLFGVDIDPRPIQVAALALWLRAQLAWRDVRYAERPRVERMNLVCAEPMPGDAAQLDAFAAGLRPAVLGDLVREVWQAMRPVGETGLLLRIDDEIRRIVRRARERWNGTNGPTQPDLLAESPNWHGRRHDLSDLAHDEAARFWSEAEERVVQALQAYAAQAGDDDRVLRRLFAEDVDRGFAFIDLSRARYDVVLMNPPFGQPAEATKDALDAAYPACGHEIYAMFFQRALELVEPHGRVGAITERDWLGQATLRGLRERVFGEQGAVILGADLGHGVLEAKVETAAVVVDRRANEDTAATWIRLVTAGHKESALFGAVSALKEGRAHRYTHQSAARRFRQLREGAYAYWMSDAVIEHYTRLPTIQAAVAEVKQGTATAIDFRFLRLAWEVDPRGVGLAQRWLRFAKGGEYRPFWDDIHLLLNWGNGGAEVIAYGRGRPQGIDFFGKPGVTWPRRTNLPLGPRVLPAGCAFGDKGPTAFPRDADRAAFLAVLGSRPFQLLLAPWLNTADASSRAISKSYEVGVVKGSGWPQPSTTRTVQLGHLAVRATTLVRGGQIEEDITGETCVVFIVPPVLRTIRDMPLTQAARRRVEGREDRFVEFADITAEIDDIVADTYGFTERDRRLMDEELEPAVARYPEPERDPDDALFSTAYLTKDALPGDRLPGGLDAEIDVRVEHRRSRQHAALRGEETICHLFEIPPRRVAAVRRRLDLLRPEDVRRAAAEVVSWAVGVVFGRWDVRLFDHPEWTPGWLDPFGSLPRCPLGQLVDGRGLPATREHVASDAWLAARTDATRLPPVEVGAGGALVLLDAGGRRLAPAEIDASRYALDVAWDGVLQDDALDDDRSPRHDDDLYRRVSRVLEHVYGAAHAEREAELAHALGVASLVQWIRRPDGFFADHLARYSKSRRRAPIYWPLATASGGLTLWLYYPRISGGMLASCVNSLLAGDDVLEDEEDRLLGARRAGTLPPAGQLRLDRLDSERRERAGLREALRELADKGFRPHLDDGTVVNAAPLAAWFRHRPWREAAEETWAEIQRGDHDWSRVALWLRGEAVLERCRTDRDLAIAHGRDDLYAPTPAAGARRRGRRRTTQLAIRDTADDDDD